ncbi:hypothetical protein MP228_007169 [Amoeboaphelidium protococcarum]|nr:hypothetical protein MP228_007169 [Amoeboaphelidium protococcarum]
MKRPPGDLILNVEINGDVQSIHLKGCETVEQAAMRLIISKPACFNSSMHSELVQLLTAAAEKKLLDFNQQYQQQQAATEPDYDLIQLWWQKKIQTSYRKYYQPSESANVLTCLAELYNDTAAFDCIMKFMGDSSRRIDSMIAQHSKQIQEFRAQYSAADLKSSSAMQRFTEDKEILQATLKSELDDLHRQQKETFMKLLNSLKEGGQVSSSLIQDTTKVSVKDPVVSKRNSIQQTEQYVDAGSVQKLQDMGFDPKVSRKALVLSKGDVNQALTLLLDGAVRVDDDSSTTGKTSDEYVIVEQNQAPQSNNSFLNQGQGMAAQNFKKLGSWFEKARSQIDRLSDSQVSSQMHEQPPQTESFTITLGTHIQHTQNVRLTVQKYSDFVRHPMSALERDALRAQTLVTLLTNKAVALVNILPIQQWESFKAGKFNDIFHRACNYETEYVFDPLDVQLRSIEDEYTDRISGKLEFCEGDILVTKHSNLPQVSTVFHLICDEFTLEAELNSKSNVIAGLRNLFGIANKYGIHELIVPVLAYPDQYTPSAGASGKVQQLQSNSKSFSLTRSGSFGALAQLVSQSGNSSGQDLPLDSSHLLKRSECILKMLKSCWMESLMTRGGEDSVQDGNSGLEVIQLVIPPKLLQLKENSGLFAGVSSQIRNIFKAI